MNGLEVEPARDSGLEVDEHVLGHGVAVRQSEPMECGEADDRQFDGPFCDRLPQLRSAILQQARQRLSRKPRQDECPVGFNPNRSAVEGAVDTPLPLLPIPLREDPHAGIQNPDQRITQPDQETARKMLGASTQQARRSRRRRFARSSTSRIAAAIQEPGTGRSKRAPPPSPASAIACLVSNIIHGRNACPPEENHTPPLEKRAKYPNGCSSIRRLDVRAMRLRS